MSEKAVNPIDDNDIMRAFLEATETLGVRETARAVAGVTEFDVSRWRNDDWKWLSAKKRRALVAYLEGMERPPAGVEEGTGSESGAGSSNTLERSDLARQIDEIRRGPGTMSEKDRAIDTIAAAYRSEALRDAEKSAVERSRAARIEAEKSSGS